MIYLELVLISLLSLLALCITLLIVAFAFAAVFQGRKIWAGEDINVIILECLILFFLAPAFTAGMIWVVTWGLTRSGAA
jgi:hypothetical protein